MKLWLWVRGVSAGVVFVSLIFLLIGTSSIIVRLALVLLVLVSLFLWIRAERKLVKETGEASTIRLLNHFRHDWMNDLQVLFGYVRLRKYEKLESFMDKIKDKAQQDSNITKLGMASLISFLLSFRMDNRAFDLELDLDQGINLNDLPLPMKKLSKLIRETILVFTVHATPANEERNELSMLFVREDDSLLVDLVYHGSYEADQLKEAMEAMIQSYPRGFVTMVLEIEADKVVVALRLPFRKK